MAQNLVGTTRPSWDDMSQYLVHFTKDTGGDVASSNSMLILSQGEIEARNKYGMGKNNSESPNCVCFSEIPLHRISRLAKKRSSFGIGFQKELIVERGGGPIMYAYKGTPHAEAMKGLVEGAKGNHNDPIWKMAPFIDTPGNHGDKKYFFEWEREWRVVGSFQFEVIDPAFLILPEALHTTVRTFLDDAEAEGLGPIYKCPFIDPCWGKAAIKTALGG